jgi:hypothetical protein
MWGYMLPPLRGHPQAVKYVKFKITFAALVVGVYIEISINGFNILTSHD